MVGGGLEFGCTVMVTGRDIVPMPASSKATAVTVKVPFLAHAQTTPPYGTVVSWI